MTMLLETSVRSTTELSKKTKEVLDTAAFGMVLIHREEPNADIAMLRHETVQRMQAVSAIMPEMVSLLRYVAAIGDEVSVTPPSNFDWLRAFDADDVRDFSVEYVEVSLQVMRGDVPMMALEDVVTQWRRSAEVLLDDEIRARLQVERSIILEGASA